MLDGLFNDTTHISESGIIKKPYYHKWYPTHTNIGRHTFKTVNVQVFFLKLFLKS